VGRGRRRHRAAAAAGGFAGGGKTQLGLLIDKKTKRIGCSNIKSIIEEKKLELIVDYEK
jgi:hypothetical protein